MEAAVADPCVLTVLIKSSPLKTPCPATEQPASIETSSGLGSVADIPFCIICYLVIKTGCRFIILRDPSTAHNKLGLFRTPSVYPIWSQQQRTSMASRSRRGWANVEQILFICLGASIIFETGAKWDTQSVSVSQSLTLSLSSPTT